jgi:hypothetical protein
MLISILSNFIIQLIVPNIPNIPENTYILLNNIFSIILVFLIIMLFINFENDVYVNIKNQLINEYAINISDLFNEISTTILDLNTELYNTEKLNNKVIMIHEKCESAKEVIKDIQKL